jgi:GcrA cell cycle regulator
MLCFCCSETANDQPYCAFHARVAYQPPSDRRRDKRPFRNS